MDNYNNDLLKFINYLNSERVNVKNKINLLEVLEYHLKNRTYNISMYIQPLEDIFTKEELESLYKYNYDSILPKKKEMYTTKLSMIEALLSKLDSKDKLDEYIKTTEFISLLKESNLSNEEQARVVYQINCINISIIDKVITKKGQLRININNLKTKLENLIIESLDILNKISTTIDRDYLNNDRIGITIKSLAESLNEEVDLAKYILDNEIELSRMKEIEDTDNLLTECINNITFILDNLSELVSPLFEDKSSQLEEKETQYSENKIVYLTDENNLPFINCSGKDSLELITDLKKGLLNNNSGVRLVKGIDSVKENVFVRIRQKESLPSISYLKINNFILVIAIDELDNIYKETTRLCNKYSIQIERIIEEINNLPLPLLHKADLLEESILSKVGKRGK